MSTHPISVRSAIAAHLAAVRADEAQLDIDGKPLNETKVAETEAAEEEAFAVFAETACLTPADVVAKIDYLVSGTIGERDSLITYLQIRDLVEPFLKSLAIAAVEG